MGLVARFVISSKHLPLAAWLGNVHSRTHTCTRETTRALRGKSWAAQSAPGILTHLIQSIISRGTFSPSVLLPSTDPPFIPFQPLSTTTQLSDLFYVRWPHRHTHFRVNTCSCMGVYRFSSLERALYR